MLNEKYDQRLRLSLRQLEVFAAMARGGSTRAAAVLVARSQSAASTALAELETTLGATLFDRIGRRLVLNDRGQALLPLTIEMLDRAAVAENLFVSGYESPLRMASSFTVGEYLLPPLIAQWKQAWPHCRVRLDIANTHDVLEAVASFDVDLGFIEGTGSHPELAVQQWRTDEVIAIVAPGHPLARGTVTAKQLAKTPWILRERGSGTREVADRWLISHLRDVLIGMELGSNEAVKRAIASGLGVGLLSRFAVADALVQGWLAEIHTPYPPMRRPLSAVVHRSKELGNTAASFLRHCMDRS